VELPLSFKKNDEGDVYARKTEFILFKFIKWPLLMVRNTYQSSK
jgi:hypothetical protein